MLGQQRLIAQIDELIAEDKFPRFSIVVGERGMEHEDVARYVANKMNCTLIELLDVKVDTIRNMISQAYKLHAQTVFSIPHADDMSINAKNAMLKVVEDAPNKAYFIMCLEDLSNTLATIQSRGIVFRMCAPKVSEIEDFARSIYVHKEDIDEDVIRLYGELCSTPGDVLYFTKHNIVDFYKYAKWVADNVTKLDGAEVFKISDKLALKDEDEKFDVRLFLKALQLQFWEMCHYAYKHTDTCGVNCDCSIVRCIGRYAQDLRIKGINKGMLIDNMILEMRKIWKSQM